LKTASSTGWGSVTLALGLAMSGPAWADDNTLFELGDLHVTWSAAAGGGVFGVSQANYGAGSFNADHPAGSRRTDPIWGEAFIKPGIGFSAEMLGGRFYANFTTIYAQTIGDGDASLFTAMRGNPGEIGLEEANFGLSGDLPAFAAGTFDLQIGRQNLVIDDGFLIADGTINAGKRANFYMVPRNVFDGLGVLHLNGTPVRADIFMLTDDTNLDLTRRGFDQPPTEFIGFDVTWFENAATDGADGSKLYADRKRYITATYFHVTKSLVDGVRTSRDGLDTYALAIGGALIPSLPDFTFYAQGVLERNGNAGRNVRANAYYIEPGWSFSNLPLSPTIYYRYSHYSGARAPGAATSEAYDPLFYGGGYRGGNFGSYYYGEILSEYFIANSNTDIHQVMLTLTMPFHVLNDEDSLNVHLIYYRYLYDQTGGLGIASDSLGHEVNLATEYQYSPHTTIAAAVGVATPGSGAKEALGQQLGMPGNAGDRFDRTTGMVEVFANFSF
jgi:hypothetical protein